MAEALALPVSIITIIQLTGQVVCLGYHYFSDLSQASEEQKSLVDHLNSLSPILRKVQDYSDNNPSFIVRREPLEECALELRKIQSKLEPRHGVKGLASCLKWPLRKKETLEHISHIERLKSNFILALAADQVVLSQAIEASIKDTKSLVESHRSDFRVESHEQSLWRREENDRRVLQKRKEVLSWLHENPFDKRHREISGRRQEGIGNWLLDKPAFINWAKGQSKRMLLGLGIAGVGKTFQCSVVIDYMQTKKQNHNFGIAYYYFDYKEQDEQMPFRILTIVIKQLASQILSLPSQLEILYDSLESEAKTATIGQLYTVLLAIIKTFSQVFLIFDAIDECHSMRKVVLRLFKQMREDGINLFLTSRPYSENIQDFLCGAKKIKISAHSGDITDYIQARINEDQRIKRLVSEGNCKAKIISEILDCANGMFLLAHFQINHLCQQMTLKQMFNELDDLKGSISEQKPLDPTYNRVLRAIMNQPKNAKELAIRTLSWIVKARRTLTVGEIRQAVSIEPDRYEIDELDLPDIATILGVCGNFVTVDEDGSTIRLAHQTIQEYLQRSSIIVSADSQLAIACTTFLSFDTFARGPCKSMDSLRDRFETQPFLSYVACHFPQHIKTCNESITKEVLLKFLSNPRGISSYKQAQEYLAPNIFPQVAPISNVPLNIACSLGHVMVVEHLLETYFDGGSNPGYMTPPEADKWGISDHDGNSMAALHYVAYYGHDTVARILLSRGADIAAKDQWLQTPLHYAIDKGHEGVVQVLLDNGADTAAIDKWGQTPLHFAAQQNEIMVKLLLDKSSERDINISVQDSYGQTPLHIAAYMSNTRVVQALLDKRADLLILDYMGRTALHIASSEGHEEVVQLLLNVGINPSIGEKRNRTALHEAAFGGFEGVTKLLLASGVDFSIKDTFLTEEHKTPDDKYKGKTALCLAALEGHIAVVLILLEWGAEFYRTTFTNPDSHDQYLEYLGWTAIQVYKLEGHESVVEKFAEYNADISVRDNLGRGLLELAVSGGSGAIVRKLVEKGADISILDSLGRPMLSLAVLSEQNEIVRFLLENGVDPTIQDRYGLTALHLAVRSKSQVAVQMLLKEGVDILIPDNSGETALQLAMFNKDVTLVQMIAKSLFEEHRSLKSPMDLLYSVIDSCNTESQAGGLLSTRSVNAKKVDQGEKHRDCILDPQQGRNHWNIECVPIDHIKHSTQIERSVPRYLPPFPNVGEIQAVMAELEEIINKKSLSLYAVGITLRSILVFGHLVGETTDVQPVVRLNDQALSILRNTYTEAEYQEFWWEDKFFQTWTDRFYTGEGQSF